MKYDELSELIDAWVTRQIESVKLDPMNLNYRNSSYKGLLNGILIGMSDEDRQSLADRFGWEKKQEFVLTQNDDEDGI